MNIQFHEKLYRDGISDRKLASIQRKIKKKSPKLELFLITFPIGKEGILEIYWYPELLQSVYQNMDVELIVVGIAKSRLDAFYLIEQIISDVGCEAGNIPVRDYFEESK